MAKNYAESHKTTLSQLVENFFAKLTEDESNEITYSPIVQELAGIISLNDDLDYKTDYHDYLAEKKVIDKALNSNFSDFEDAIQCYTAPNNGINCVITRNIKDYKASGIIVQTPEAFLAGKDFNMKEFLLLIKILGLNRTPI